MDVQQYLQRIEYAGPLEPTIEVLSALQLTHLLTVPFENLDIHNKISIDLKNLFDKIVTRKRGGFCYELNGLFHDLLQEIGFTVKMISARVYDSHKKSYSPEFDHMALIVSIDNARYLVDVGFGEFALSPVTVELHKETNDPRGVFRMESFDEPSVAVEKKDPKGSFIPEYIFSEQERHMEEFYDQCLYHQTNPESHFMQNRICSLPTNDGRITLTGNLLKITEGGIVIERHLNDELEVQQELWHYFGVKL